MFMIDERPLTSYNVKASLKSLIRDETLSILLVYKRSEFVINIFLHNGSLFLMVKGIAAPTTDRLSVRRCWAECMCSYILKKSSKVSVTFAVSSQYTVLTRELFLMDSLA